MLSKLLQELLSVNMFRKGVLCLLGCSVAALKISDLAIGKKQTLHETLYLETKMHRYSTV